MKSWILVLALITAAQARAEDETLAPAQEKMASELPSSSETADHAFNLRFNPLRFFGGGHVIADFALTPDWTIGPALSYLRFSVSKNAGFTSDFAVTGYTAGVRANWFQEGVFNSGLYVGPSLQYSNVKVSSTDSSGDSRSVTSSPIVLSGIVGYGWFWRSFNMMLGGGIDLSLGGSKVTMTDSSGNSTEINTNVAGPALEFTMGWAI